MKTPIKTYDTRAEALTRKNQLDNGTYYLSHGEYERPTYRVLKTRGKYGFYIYARYFYYSGTFYATQNGPLLAH